MTSKLRGEGSGVEEEEIEERGREWGRAKMSNREIGIRVGPPPFLKSVSSTECERKESRKVQTKVKQGSLPKRGSFYNI